MGVFIQHVVKLNLTTNIYKSIRFRRKQDKPINKKQKNWKLIKSNLTYDIRIFLFFTYSRSLLSTLYELLGFKIKEQKRKHWVMVFNQGRLDSIIGPRVKHWGPYLHNYSQE